MKVQTCARESQLKNTKASPCRVLVGNQDPSVSVTTHYCVAKKWVAAMKSGSVFLQFCPSLVRAAYSKGVSPDNAVGYWPADADGYRTDYATFGEWYQAMYNAACSSIHWVLTDPASWTNYTFDVTYTITGLNNYYNTTVNSQTGGGGGISTAGFAPFGAFDYYFGTTVEFANVAPTNDPTSFGGIWNDASIAAADASMFWVSAAGGGPTDVNYCQFTYGGTVPYADHYTFAQGRFLAQTFTFGPGFELTFNELGGTPEGDNPSNPSSFYDLSNIVSAGDVVTTQIRGAHALCGWQVSDQLEYFLLFRQLAKLNAVSSISRPYFIGRLQSSNFNAGLAKAFAPTTAPGGFRHVTISNITIISSGIIQGGQVIGMAADGADIAMPFPADNPFPLTNLGSDSVILEDYYFAVIGTDPSAWAATNSYKLGLNQIGDFLTDLGAGDTSTGAGASSGAGGGTGGGL